MIIFSNCKINLGLRVVRKRADGYHELETVFYPVPFHDIIEVMRPQQPEMSFTMSGLSIEGAPEQNLCMKAYALLQRSHELPPIQLHLHKTIPTGAGLGGGSANAAHTLLLLNKKFNLNLSSGQLLDLALQLGSDCPFFIVNKPCIASGRGELLQTIDLDHLQQYTLVIVHPGIHISTAWAFSQVTPGNNGHPVHEAISLTIENWRDRLVNDFEGPVFRTYPAIAAIKQSLYERGAIYASMSGSGSAVFGLFEAVPELDFKRYTVNIFDLSQG
ncbi:MAG TPA: 4-(cytidine 5'-diphospho)-2-C-methyl-D-erythritol kinase [Chitinophagaceae bacterium]|nr:4-(cytidine 5'-diphospho)-2-C-methyl-D-erythritol kinase [Chitinophagaceae bacterium]